MADHAADDAPTLADGKGDDREVEIRAEGLEKSFGDHAVLRGIDLTLPRGDLLAIIGGSGCGKTVFLHHLIGLHEPTAGRVLATDHERPDRPLVDLATLDEEEMDELRIHWAVVFQKNALFSESVYENIAVWLREIKKMPDEQIRERAREALKAVGFTPDDALLAKHRNQLSGGMAKRVALARAIAMDPIVTFYDEPTTGLDPSLAYAVQDTIHAIHGKPTDSGVPRSTVIITHDKDLLARLRPRIVMLDQGQVALDGTYDEFASSDLPQVEPYLAAMPELHARPPQA